MGLSTSVDISKTRRKIEDALRKDTADENLIKLAEQLGVEIAYLPHQPEDYHDELGRPSFGPKQVRHASDLRIGQIYWLVTLGYGKRKKEIARHEIKLSGLHCETETIHSEYTSEHGEDIMEWYAEYTFVNEDKDKGRDGTYAIRLSSISICPIRFESSLRNRNIWTRLAYLEFTENQLCSCGIFYCECSNVKKGQVQHKFDHPLLAINPKTGNFFCLENT